ncbi:acid protease [Hyaloscypha variabilis F]|uniref:Acid protease n=1 Tax=Hyaloscypha variabilis (strain UAMH 11265 / GT02V1 / F) TaxID=1149755 RepID=A0A2J6RMY8_HYAVF|nr:acid protease [Hyaloscypha variabilis F]
MFSWRALPAATLSLLLVLDLVETASAVTIFASRTTKSLAPLVVPPSQLWDGNDGPWSSFFLRVGTPPQTMRTFVSTANNQPLVVLNQGCLSCDPSGCENSRGGTFYTNTSSTWIQSNITLNGIFAVAIETNLGITAEAQYGSDVVALGSIGSGLPTISDQLLGGTASKDFFLGTFGVNAAPSSISNLNDPIPSYLSTLKAQSIIPSLSYGYTAGNQYRFNKVFGSLTLGGYDASLFEPNDLTFKFNDNGNLDLTVHVDSISISSNHVNTTISSVPFPAFVDSTVPYLYLPIGFCKKFEEAFGITYDTTSGLYLVNSTLHTKLLEQSANVTFTLTNSTGTTLVEIVLPYQAFDLKAKWPLVKNSTRYFPLKRAANNSQTTLGRAFLQEAYLIADYERSNFSLYQRKWVANAQPDIQTIYAINETAKPPNQAKTTSQVSIPVAIAGTLGAALFLTVVIGCILVIWKRNQRLNNHPLTISYPIPKPPSELLAFLNDRNESYNHSPTSSLNDRYDSTSSHYTSELEAEGAQEKSQELDTTPIKSPIRNSILNAKVVTKPQQVFELPAGEVNGDGLFGFVAWRPGRRG